MSNIDGRPDWNDIEDYLKNISDQSSESASKNISIEVQLILVRRLLEQMVILLEEIKTQREVLKC